MDPPIVWDGTTTVTGYNFYNHKASYNYCAKFLQQQKTVNKFKNKRFDKRKLLQAFLNALMRNSSENRDKDNGIIYVHTVRSQKTAKQL